MKRWKILVVVLVLGSFSGCANINYYFQAIGGQMDINHRAQSIDGIVRDPHAQPALKTKLSTVLNIREFASRELRLPNNHSYRSYADLERPYVVWNVFATPEFSVKPKQWCFLLTGCVNYRGYFAKADAEQFAGELKKQGYDVYVAGVPAYSTLGWFDDPVLNTFLHYPDVEIARLIFHELAHQLVYVQSDSTFNESFATAIEIEGLRRWLERNGTSEQKSAAEQALKRKQDFTALVLRFRGELEQLYESDKTDSEKRIVKAKILQNMQEAYAEQKAAWGGYSGYDRWFAQQPKNAHLASVATYTTLLPEFQALLQENQGNLEKFYSAVRDLAKNGKDERNLKLGQALQRNKAHNLACDTCPLKVN